MANQVTLTASMRSNLLSLQNTQRLFDMTQERLSTGKKVNSALDNPSSYFAAQSLNSRATQLETLMDGMGQATQTLKAADTALTTLNTYAEQAKALVNNALDTSNNASYKIGGVNVALSDDLSKMGGISGGDKFVIRTGEADKLETSKTYTGTQTLAAGDFSLRLVDKEGNFQQIDISNTTTTTVNDMMKNIQDGFGRDKQGNYKVTASLVDGKISVVANDKTMSLIAMEKETAPNSGTYGTAAADLGFDVGYEVDLAPGTTTKAANYSKVVALSSQSTLAGKGGDFEFSIGGVDHKQAVSSTDTVSDLINKLNTNYGTSIKAEWDSTKGGMVITAIDPNHAIETKDNANIFGGIVAGTNALKEIDQAATHDYETTLTASVGAISDGTSVSLGTINNTAASFTINTGDDAAAVATKMQAAIRTAGGADYSGVTVSNTSGTLTIAWGEASSTGFAPVDGGGVTFGAAATTDNGDPATYKELTVSNVYDLMTKINGMNGVEASITKDGKLQVKATNGQDMVITDITGNAGAALGISGVADNGTTVRLDYSKQFDEIMGQIDALVTNGDTGYKGVNLLNGDNLTVNFNETRTSQLGISGVKMDTMGLGLKNAQNDWRTSNDINKSLEQIDKAINSIKTVSSAFAQNLSIVQTREDFTKNMVDTLVAGADKLVLADMNEEAANMLALQTRQQLGTNALSLANQAQQGVLRLF